MQGLMEGIGFRTANVADRVALRGIHLQARLSGMSLKATLEQTFINLEPNAIEAIYTFPLPEGSAVCGFEVITGERVLTGTVEEINQGIEQYEQAVSEGHGAFMMEQERPDVFTMRVGNLKPRQAATIRLTYICPLERVDKSIRVVFPTTVAPRFISAEGMNPLDAAMDGDALNPPHVLNVPYGLSMEVDVALGRQLARVSSSSHVISIANGEDATCRITFAGGVAEMDRDVVLLLELAREQGPCVQAVRGAGGETYLAVTFVPEFDDDQLLENHSGETIFVLDCSGSMMGDSIAQATAALELCLRSMSIGDTFNICCFGSTWELLCSEPLAYSQMSLNHALSYIRNVHDLGGTELHPPLEAILSQKSPPGVVRQIILLTDGQVSNEPAVVELARKYRKYNRIFSFGIGSACSAYLVKGIARASGGASEFITAGECIDDKVLRTFGRIASPPVTDLSIDWDGCDVQTLAELPPVFDGDVLAVFGRTTGRFPKKVTLNCNTPSGPQSWSVAVPPPLEDTGVIATMWARRTIQSMEEVNGTQVNRSRVPGESREREILIGLSKQFGLLCSLTTFVAVEHRSLAERNNGQPAVRRVPVLLAAGWGDVDTGTGLNCLAPGSPAAYLDGFGGGAAAMSAPAPMQAAPPKGAAIPLKARLKKAVSGRLSRRKMEDDSAGFATLHERSVRLSNASPATGTGKSLDRSFDDSSLSDAVPDATTAPMFHLLSLQSADGSFGWNDHTTDRIKSIGANTEQWRVAILAALPPSMAASSRDMVVNTVIAIELLRKYFPDRESLWRRALRKACREYLPKALGMTTAEVDAWLKEVKKNLRT